MEPPATAPAPNLNQPVEPEVTWLGPVMRTIPPPAAVRVDYVALWVVFFGLNLIVPLLLGGSMCGPLGLVGLFVAIGFTGVFGFSYLRAYPALQVPALTGAIVVALSQLAPALQIGAGMLGLTVARMLESGPQLGGNLGLVGGFYATFITGQVLIVASLLIGGVFRLIGRLLGKASRAILRESAPAPTGAWATGRPLEPPEPAEAAGRDRRGG